MLKLINFLMISVIVFVLYLILSNTGTITQLTERYLASEVTGKEYFSFQQSYRLGAYSLILMWKSEL